MSVISHPYDPPIYRTMFGSISGRVGADAVLAQPDAGDRVELWAEKDWSWSLRVGGETVLRGPMGPEDTVSMGVSYKDGRVTEVVVRCGSGEVTWRPK